MGTRRETIRHSKATIGCVCLLASMVVMYLYFLNMSVVQVVMRTEHVQKQNKLNTEIAMLETSFIEAQHNIASRIASLDGYEKDTAKIFISREQSSFVLGGR